LAFENTHTGYGDKAGRELSWIEIKENKLAGKGEEIGEGRTQRQ